LIRKAYIDLFCVLSLARMRTGFPSAFAFSLSWMLSGVKEGFYESLTHQRFDFFLGLLISYLYGVVVNLGNTVSDLREDRVNTPHRVKVARFFGIKRVLRMNDILSFIMIALSLLSRNVFFIGAVMLGSWLMNQYNFRPFQFKRKTFLSLFSFAGGVYGPFLLAYFLSNPGSIMAPSLQMLWLFILLTVWYGFFGTAKNVQDYDGDKASGIRTTATLFSSKENAVRFVGIVLVASLMLFVIPVLAGVLPLHFLYLQLWLLFVIPVQILNYRNRNNPAALKKIQSKFFLYPILFMPSIMLVMNLSWFTAAFIGLLLLLLFLFEKMNLDARNMNCYKRLMRLTGTQPDRIQR